MSFQDLGLEAELLRAVSDEGYSEATPVQREAIPVILEGRDVLAGAQTGTGKTAGFTLPLLQKLMHAGEKNRGGRQQVQVLILTPTRELAAQVATSVRTYGRHLPLSCTVIFGGVSINPQIQRLRRGVDIVVATPGRLLDHVQRGTLDLSAVRHLVLDEADRMLDMGFMPDIKRILGHLPAQRQNLMFSATYSKEIRKLADGLLNNPVQIEVARRNTAAESVEQMVYPVDKSRKREMLSHLIGERNWRQVLVFSRTKHGANRLSKQLEIDGISSTAIHGNKSQAARTRALDDFKKGKIRVLVATDIAARGLDIDLLPHVVNYDLPQVPEDYVHRIGRTGRAGQEGQAVSLVADDEVGLLKGIERVLQRTLPQEVLEGYEQDPNRKPAPARPAGNQRQRQGRSRNARGGQNNRSGQAAQRRPGGAGKQGGRRGQGNSRRAA